MAQLFKNNAATTLNGALTNSATTITVTNATVFGAVASPDFMLLTIVSGSPESSWEIVKVTGISGNNLTVVRGQDGTSGVAWNSGDKIECRWTATAVPAGTIIRETFSNVAYTLAGAADRHLGQIGTMSAGRTVTLPTAAGRAGQRIVIQDESGSVTQTNKITVARGGTDTIGPGAQTSFDMVSPGCSCELISDGVSNWTLVRLSLQRWTFTSGTTAWVAPPGVYSATTVLAGGGGAGGGSAAGGTLGGNGGAAGEFGTFVVAVTPGTSYNVVVGAGGTGVSNGVGNQGAQTTFGTIAKVNGGSGGDKTTLHLSVSPGTTSASVYFTQSPQAAPFTLAPPGWGGHGGDASTTSSIAGGGNFGYAGGAAGNSGAFTAGGGGGSGPYGSGGAGAAGGGTGANGTSASANTGAGGGGAGAGSAAHTGGDGGSGKADVYCSI